MADNGIDLAELFLNIAQSKQIERLKKRLEEEKPPPEPEPEQPATAKFFDDIAEIPRDLESVDAQGDPVRAYFALEDLKRRLSALDASAMSPEAGSELASLSSKLQAKYNQVLSRWDDQTRADVQRLGRLLSAARRTVQLVLARIEGTEKPGDHEQALSLTAEVSKLKELTTEIEQTAARVPGLQLERMPGWDVIESARTSIVEPHSRNVFLYKCAVMMTRADGELAAVERDFLHDIAERIHLSRNEAETLMTQASQVHASEFVGSPQEAKDLVHKLYLCALADGVVAESEKRMLNRIAHSIGVPDKDVFEIVAGDRRQGISFLDAEAVRQFLIVRGPLPKNAFTAEDLPPERMAAIREDYGIPEDENVLLVYENRFLDKTFEFAAMTGRTLFMRMCASDCSCASRMK